MARLRELEDGDRPRARERKRVVIAGAAGRDFHDFNVVFRDDPAFEVVAFTATQIPGIAGRRYPVPLAGGLYPRGIPIEPESELEAICRREGVGLVVFAYSDVTHAHVMHLGSRALACGADFALLGPERTMLAAHRPVIAVSAVRTGCGKSQTARWLVRRLAGRGFRVAALRHPMPYGDLARQRVQRFATHRELDEADCTLEEREEYEPYVEAGSVVFAGVDYAEVLKAAESEADLIVWDGGNNDFPFLRPDLHLAIVDALRPDQVATHHPGETVARLADVVVVNKVDAASTADVQRAIDAIRAVNGRAEIVRAASPVTVDDPAAVRGRRVVVVDDGPTLTHGGMSYGAGYVGAVAAGAAEIVDPRPFAAPGIREIFTRYTHIGRVLPALGYGREELEALRRTLEDCDAEVVVSGSPLDLAARLGLAKPVVRARYSFVSVGAPGLGDLVDAFVDRLGAAAKRCSS
jgi:predicted GTPase